MEKLLLSSRQKRLSTHHSRNKKKQQQQQPFKVVYITNPIRFNTSVSEFKALVQELTGKHADYSPRSVLGGGGAREDDADADGGAATAKEVMEFGSTVGDELEELAVVGKMERPGNGGALSEGSDPVLFGSGFDGFCYSGMDIKDLEGMASSNLLLDVFQSLNDM